MKKTKKLMRGAIAMAVMATSLSLSGAVIAEKMLDDGMRVTLLGTGSPIPSPDRFSQAILVEAGEQKLLFDLGRGVTISLAQLDIPFRDIDASFITHMHSDHLVGLPDFWLSGWLPTPFGSREEPMKLYGPHGTEHMADHLTQAFAEDIRIRKADEELEAPGVAFEASDIVAGPVYEQDGVKVTAFETEHGELIKPSYGYTITYQDYKVVIPSDSVYDENVAREAAGADLLVHEVAMIDHELREEYPRLNNVIAHHTSPEDAGRIFSQASPRLAAYTHYVIFAKGEGSDASADEKIEELTRTTYEGPLVLGQDLTSFLISEDNITVTTGEGKEVMVLNDGASNRDGSQR